MKRFLLLGLALVVALPSSAKDHPDGVSVPMNAAVTELVHRIEQGQLQPAPARLDELSLSWMAARHAR
jgi:hypothetical protein